MVAAEWVNEFIQKFSGGIAHTFIFHGAVDDYVSEESLKLDSYLSQLLATRKVVCYYNCSRGINFANPSMVKPFYEAIGMKDKVPEEGERVLEQPHEALPALERALLNDDLKGKMALIIEYPELIWPENDYGHLSESDRINLATLRRWATESEFIDQEQIIILITPTATDLHSSLRTASSMIEQVEIPYPNTEQREAFIKNRLANSPDIKLSENLDAGSFAALTGGLSRMLVDDICLRAGVENRPIDVSLIKDRKDTIIRAEFGEVIEILEPRFGFDAVGGMDEVKRYLKSSVIGPLRGQAPIARMPAGVLLAGPPGTGKTLLVAALAYEAGVSVVKLNAGRLLGQYVGTSERNLEKALTCIRSLVPTIVMIDEIEQQLQRGGAGDGGVERRIFGRILEEMSGSGGTSRGDVVWFAATNRVDRVDAALRRPGRFDRIVPILPPSPEERWEIFLTKLPPESISSISNAEATQLVAATENYTGADIEGLLIKAAELSFDEHREQIAGQDLLRALAVLKPSSGAGEIEEMISVALEHCNDLSLVPPKWREAARGQK